LEEPVSESSAVADGGGQGEYGGLDPALAERLRRILRDVQGVWPAGLDDPLPSLTDRSITMLNLLVAIDDDLRVEVPLDVVYDVKTLRELAEAVAAQPSYRGMRR
jgi:acyl carrier protein